MYLQYLEEIADAVKPDEDQHRQEGRKENEREKQVELL